MELLKELQNAADYFQFRGFTSGNEEVLIAIEKLKLNDYLFVEDMYFRCAPTCDIEKLFITEYSEEDEAEVEKLNSQLATVINNTYSALSKIYENT